MVAGFVARRTLVNDYRPRYRPPPSQLVEPVAGSRHAATPRTWPTTRSHTWITLRWDLEKPRQVYSAYSVCQAVARYGASYSEPRRTQPVAIRCTSRDRPPLLLVAVSERLQALLRDIPAAPSACDSTISTL